MQNKQTQKIDSIKFPFTFYKRTPPLSDIHSKLEKSIDICWYWILNSDANINNQ